MPKDAWEEVKSLFSDKLFADRLSRLRNELLERHNYSEILKQVTEETSKRFWKRFYAYCAKQHDLEAASDEELKLLEAIPPGCLDLFGPTRRHSAFPKPFYFIEVKAAKGRSLGLSSNQRKFIGEFVNKLGILILHMQYSAHGICLRYLLPQR